MRSESRNDQTNLLRPKAVCLRLVLTDRAMFTGPTRSSQNTMTDIVTSNYRSGTKRARLGAHARPLSGFAETSQYIASSPAAAASARNRSHGAAFCSSLKAASR
jgi:glyoxylate utilization-related uncharacterized protein